MRVLVACEFSGTVRDAFLARGHDAWSCDIVATTTPGPHFECPVEEVIHRGWDMMIAHPPCTYLAVSGARWWAKRATEQRDALAFVRFLLSAPVPRIAVENPVGKISTAIEPPTQYIQPWQFGHGETKKTGLWLRNLPRLQATDIVQGRSARIHRMAPSPERGRLRSIFYPGIARAMAEQWGSL